MAREKDKGGKVKMGRTGVVEENPALVIVVLAVVSLICGLMFIFAGQIRDFSITTLNGLQQISRTVSEPGFVPEGLTAHQYYLMGVSFKGRGWVESSRKALLKAAAADSGGMYGHCAKVFIKTCLPKNPISRQAEQDNIEAFNLMGGNGLAAATKFRTLIGRYPEFEWPLGNLASMYLEENNLSEAEPLIKRALEINPHYLNGWRYMAELKLRQNDRNGALDAYQHALDSLGPPELLDSMLQSFRDDILNRQETIKLAKQRSM